MDIKCYKAYHGADARPEDCPLEHCIGTRKAAHVEHYEPHLGRHLAVTVIPYYDKDGSLNSVIHVGRDISERKQSEQEREKLIGELQKAMGTIRTLQGILPICSSCKKIRDEQGSWHQVETYIRAHSGADFSHGMCPDCAKKLYPGIFDKPS
ncbi:MAG: hypothetical protein OHK006_11060 [Thermodesulfovibrionales bacterium]